MYHVYIEPAEEMELQLVVMYHVGAGNGTLPFSIVTSALNS